MCGGAGSRLDVDGEKPLYRIAGEPMVDRVRRALAESTVETTYGTVSPIAPETQCHLEAAGVSLIETPGDGYVPDLGHALADSRIEPPVLTVAADLPLLSAATVDDVCHAYREQVATTSVPDPGESAGNTTPAAAAGPPPMTVCVPVELKRRLGVSVEEQTVGDDHLVPTGLNVIGTADGESSRDLRHVVSDVGAAINVNRLEDAAIATDYADRTE